MRIIILLIKFSIYSAQNNSQDKDYGIIFSIGVLTFLIIIIMIIYIFIFRKRENINKVTNKKKESLKNEIDLDNQNIQEINHDNNQAVFKNNRKNKLRINKEHGQKYSFFVQ